MKIDKRDLIIFFLTLLIGLGIGYFIFRSKPKEIIVEKIVKVEETKMIDSLNAVIKTNEYIIESLKDSVREKIVYVETKVEEIKELPIDSNLMILRDNLLVYGQNFSILDSLPSLCTIEDSNDTLVLMSEGNLIDINTMFVKYEGQVYINDCYLETINKNNEIISLMDSIIHHKDIIIEDQSRECEADIKDLQKKIEKEKRKQVYYTVGGVIVAGTLTYLIATRK